MAPLEPPFGPTQAQAEVVARWFWPFIGLGASTLAGWLVFVVAPKKGQVTKLIAIVVATVVLVAILDYGLISRTPD